MSVSKSIFLTLIILILHSPFCNLQSQILAPTPPMGWNSWNCFQEKINEQQIREIADAMVSSGMRDAGYEYLVLDDGWMAKERDENGDLQADPEKFPSGMKAIGDYIHSKGLKYGIYECRGYLTCQKLPGSFEHEEADMAKFAEWGVDYIKLDACYAEKNGRLTTEDLQVYKDAIEKTGRPMLLSISDFGNGAWVWGGKEYGQLWRTGYDIYPWIENVYHHAESSGGDSRIHPAFNGLWQFAGPGYWNDPDMLQVGNLKSEMEDKIHMSLWCILASPLMAGNDLREISDTVTQILIAPEIIAVNQDSRGHQGYKVFDNGKQIIYNKPLSDGTTAVLMFNKDTIPADITVKWEQIGLTGKQKVRDLWAQKNLGKFKDSFTAKQLPEHGQYMLKIGKKGSDPVPGPTPVPEEKYTATSNGFSYLSDLYYMMKYGPAPEYDKNPEGDPISIDGEVYDKGLSCNNGSILIYKLAGNSHRFRAMVGLDDSYKGEGTGRFKVLNEDAFGGRVLFDSGLMTKDSLPKQIDIDVRGLDCLFLKFDGKEDAIGDWGHARLVGSWDEHRVTYEDKYIDSIIKQTELIPIRVNGEKDNRINIVIINRWEDRDERPYKGDDMRAEFLDDVNRSLLAAFTPGDPAAQTAYANYQQFFNLYALWWPGTPKWRDGVETDLIDAMRDRLFLPWKNEHTGWVTFLLMPNRDGGGGGAARNLEDRVGNAVIVGNAIGKMLHEISHTCTSIGDEYTAAGTGTEAVPTYTASLEYRRDELKWRAWVDPNTPLPTPYEEEYLDKLGAFEGSQYHLTKYFRPSAQGCIMGAGVFDNTEEMCDICGQRLSMRMYTLVEPIEEAFPIGKEIMLTESRDQHFSVKRVHPIPDTQETHWIVNGKIVASGVDAIHVDLELGKEYEVVFTLRDTTSFIREDPPFGEFPYRERRWLIRSDVSKEMSPKYTFVWTDTEPKHEAGIRYEAEMANFNKSVSEISDYFGASEQRFVKLGANLPYIEWDLEVDNEGVYPLGFVFASAQKGKTNMELWINDEKIVDSLDFPETRPMYTGWDIVKVNSKLKKGKNRISLKSSESTQIHLDYLWLPENEITVNTEAKKPASFVMEDIELKRLPKGVKVNKPDSEMEYLWYTNNTPDFEEEVRQEPISKGIVFSPEKKGNYYVSARKKSNGSESSNRKGFYYNTHISSTKTNEFIPDQTKTAKLILWLDASDLDGDGQVDNPAPPRDPYKNWREKATGMKGPMLLYKPNQLNNMGTAGFEMVWVTNLEKPVKNFQTIIMVYKESTMSFEGKSPFITLDPYIGRSKNYKNQIFSNSVLSETKDGKTWLNGQAVDPFNHANPMEYCILTVELASSVDREIKTTSGYWEGSLAEMLVYDGVLSDEEREAVEAGLRRKWFSVK